MSIVGCLAMFPEPRWSMIQQSASLSYVGSCGFIAGDAVDHSIPLLLWDRVLCMQCGLYMHSTFILAAIK